MSASQYEGETMFVHGKTYHSGFTYGVNVAETWSYGDKEWRATEMRKENDDVNKRGRRSRAGKRRIPGARRQRRARGRGRRQTGRSVSKRSFWSNPN